MKAQHGHHVIPKKTLLTVFGVLVALTILTAVTAQLDLGGLDVPLALAIATTKAGLVVMFFMALKYDNRVNSLTFALGVVFVIVFLTFTLFDTAFRGDLGNVGTETISDIDRMESLMRDREAGFPEDAGTGLELEGTEEESVELGVDSVANVETDTLLQEEAAAPE